ncbi:hypothetical protein [Streptomyces erythrochromogenes]|uniref:hypothetical protein n=1 Tax=Streptomyces erythrochromogenes TaxID=285574 RepID=UPI0036F6036C
MRWRISDAKLAAQKEASYREANDSHHTVNLDYFHGGDHHEIPGYNPGAFRSDPQLGQGLHEIHSGSLSPQLRESLPFAEGREAGCRPSGSFSPSSHRSEAELESNQGMPPGYGEYYR